MKKLMALLCALLIAGLVSGCAVVDHLIAPQGPDDGASAIPEGTDPPSFSTAKPNGHGGKAAAASAQPQADVTPAVTVQPTPQPWEGMTVDFEHLLDDANREYARITGRTPQGEEAWSIETEHLDVAQMERIFSVGLYQDRFYFVQDGSLIALSVADGAELWRNGDFSGAATDCEILSDGTVYLCGYFGPDFYSCDREGRTLLRIPTLDEDYFWAYRLELQTQTTVLVTLEGGPEGSDPQGYTFLVDTSDGSSRRIS